VTQFRHVVLLLYGEGRKLCRTIHVRFIPSSFHNSDSASIMCLRICALSNIHRDESTGRRSTCYRSRFSPRMPRTWFRVFIKGDKVPTRGCSIHIRGFNVNCSSWQREELSYLCAYYRAEGGVDLYWRNRSQSSADIWHDCFGELGISRCPKTVIQSLKSHFSDQCVHLINDRAVHPRHK